MKRADVVITGAVVLVIVAFFALIGAVVISSDNANQQKYEQCLQQNMQWIAGSCVK